MPNDLMTFLADEAGELRATLIGQFLLHQMAKQGLTARQAAEAAGISVATLYDYISGRIKGPPASRLDSLAVALGLPSGAFEILRAGDGATLGAAELGALTPATRRDGHEDEEEEDGPDVTRAEPEPEPEIELQDEEPEPDEPEPPAEDAEAEVTAAIDSGAVLGEIEGYASLFNKLDAKGTMMAPGAFAATIRATQTLYHYWEHSHSLPRRGTSTPIGVTVLLAEDSFGLWYRSLVADTPKGREFMTLLEVGEIAGKQMGASVGGDPMEFRPGFTGEPKVFERGVDKPPGLILSFDLLEISAAAFPALAGAFARIARGDLADRIDASTNRIARILGG